MAGATATFHNPYAGTPGSSTPSPEVTPQEGSGELWAFFWLALANTAIIAVAGVATWLLIHH
jgi:hypothetical protein